jgi:hypothetical protein
MKDEPFSIKVKMTLQEYETIRPNKYLTAFEEIWTTTLYLLRR